MKSSLPLNQYRRVRLVIGLALVLTIPFAQPIYSNPTGATVRHGDISITGTGGNLQIHQSTSHGIIDWQTFSIQSGEVTRFIQPGSSSVTLNRVTGQSLSSIDGSLLANGRIILLNPNGVMVGRNGIIDTGGFTASTLDLSDQDFLAGGDLRLQGDSAAGIVNLGSINAVDGDVFLIAESVVNQGTISAPNGTVGLASGNDVLIAESGSERVFVRGSGKANEDTGVINRGTVNANIAELKSYGGNIYGMAVKNEGRVAATAVTRQGGQIFLSAGGRSMIRSTGSLVAKSADQDTTAQVKVDSGDDGTTEIGGTISADDGGDVMILGSQIDVFDGALILADGENGGGRIFVGGGRRGQDPDLMNAETVNVADGASFSASAINDGDGGEVILFSEGQLDFSGDVAATGGVSGGNGGFIELSGQNAISIGSLSGQVDLSAPNGDGGTLLIDPDNIVILPFPGGGEISSPTNASLLAAGDISEFLNGGGNLIIETTANPGSEDPGNITLLEDTVISWVTAGSSLTFNAQGEFKMESGSSISGAGDISIYAKSINLDNALGIASPGYGITLAPIDPLEDIHLGVAGDRTAVFHLTQAEIDKLSDGDLTTDEFSGITIGNTVFGQGTVTIDTVTFSDPVSIVVPVFLGDGEIYVRGELRGTDNASITLNGAGGELPAWWGDTATTYLYADIVTEGQDIVINDEVVLAANVSLDTTNKGVGDFGDGALVDIFGTVTSNSIANPFTFDVNAGTDGDINFRDTVGVSELSVGDITLNAGSLILENSLTTLGTLDITVSSNFSLDAPAQIYAVGDVIIRANQGDVPTTGNFPGMEINSGIFSTEGGIQLFGTGGDFDEDGDGNRGVWLRSGSGLSAFGDILVSGSTWIPDEFGVVIDTPVESLNGGVTFRTGEGDIRVTSDVMALNEILFTTTSGNSVTYFVDSDLYDYGSLSFAGGAGTEDTVSFADSFAGYFDAYASQFDGIEFLVGTPGSDDYFYGAYDAPASFTFTGENEFNYSEGSKSIQVSGFEEFYSGSEADFFIFEEGGSATYIEGGGGLDTLDFTNFGSEIAVDLDYGSVSDVYFDTYYTEFYSFENVIASTGDFDNEIYGTTGNDLVNIEGNSRGFFEIPTESVGVTQRINFDGFLYVDTWDGHDEFVIDFDGVGGHSFDGTLAGAAGDDTFFFRSFGSVEEIKGGSIWDLDDEGFDTIDFSESLFAYVYVDLEEDLTSGVEDFDDIDHFVGGGIYGADLSGTEHDDFFTITGSNSGYVETESSQVPFVSFTNFDYIDGADGNDLFTINISGPGAEDVLTFNLDVETGEFPEAPPMPEASVFVGALAGGEGADTFRFLSGQVAEIIGGDSGNFYPDEDVLDFSNIGEDLLVELGSEFLSALTSPSEKLEIPELVTFSLGPVGPVISGGSGVQSFSEIETVAGGNGENTLLGTETADEVYLWEGGNGEIYFVDPDPFFGREFSSIASFSLDEVSAPMISLNFERFSTISAGGGDDEFTIDIPNSDSFTGVLNGDSGNDLFVINSGGGVGEIDGGSGVDTLDFSGFSSPVTVDLEVDPEAPSSPPTYVGTATQVDSFRGVESVIGGSGEDTLSGTEVADQFLVDRDNGGNVNGIDFEGFEILQGRGGNDQFRFANQAVVSRFVGGPAIDTFILDDSDLGGTNTYVVSGNSVSRNPFYLFSEVEFLQFFLGPGNDTVITDDNGLIQLLNGGGGTDTINFGTTPVIGRAPFLFGGSQVFETGFENFIFVRDQTNNPDNVVPQVGGNGGETGDGSLIDQFSNTGGLGEALGNACGALAGRAILAGQASVIQVDGGQYQLQAPASLDGFFTQPPPAIIELLNQSLEVDAWTELADSIDFGGATILVLSDGPYSISLDGVPPNEIIGLLTESLLTDPAKELIDALELAFVIPITSIDGAVSILTVPVAIDPAALQQLLVNLDDLAYSELTSALGD
ncbi:MAG: filamentous hemagglutinin N-terminal domain-containing protein [Verrucomicrobiales bacterium]|nr:filamentous hemagglutinin N-terminal domain-containing protein [Verrucomicrobiales bacterium]